MDISIYFAIKVFVSAIVVASLFDMFVTQELRSSSYYPLLYLKTRKPTYWGVFRFIGGDRALDFISSRTILFPLAELVFGVSIVLSIYSVGFSLLLLPKLLFAILFVLLTIVPLSLDKATTPHKITVSGTVLGIIISGLVGGISGMINSILGALVGFGILYAFYLFGILYAKLIGHEGGEPMGFGTVTAMIMTGAFCGYPNAILAGFIGIIAAGIVSMISLLYLKIRGNYQAGTTYLPYSPFMVIGGAIVIYILPLLPFSIF